MEEDDLKALRSAALASLSSKAEPLGTAGMRDEEDLEALRKAALMTRKQNQIQVIHRQKETQLLRPSIPVPMPIAPSLKNIPPPSLLFPPPLHSMSIPPPPIFSHSIIVRGSAPAWGTNNLISLTPGLPGSPRPNFLQQSRSTFHPVVAQLPRLPVHRIGPRVIAVTQAIDIKKPTVINKVPEETEQKNPDKFSRYDPDSSSEDEDEHSTVKKKDGDVSDAESVASKKSFSSVSDTNDNLDATTGKDEDKGEIAKEGSKQEEEVKSDPGTPLQDEPCDDDISIIGDNEDDDILAAIDDFLEDRPEKNEPKKVTQSKNSNKKEREKIKPTPVVYERSSIPKQIISTKTLAVGSPSDPSKVDEKKLDKANIQGVTTIKPATQGNKGNSLQKSKKQTEKQTQSTAPAQEIRSNEGYEIPVVSKRMVPSPRRQRRDSDLDSVGTSDLSFLSSDEDERKIEPKKESRKRPRTRSISDDMEKRRNERLKKEPQSRSSDPQSKSKRKVQGSARRLEKEIQAGRDLRKKLENKGVKRPKIASDHQGTETTKEPKSRLDNKGSLKKGVISLKPKNSDLSDLSVKLSSKASDRKIVVTASTRRKSKAVKTDTQRIAKDNHTVTPKTPQKDITRVKKMKFSELSPIVAPSKRTAVQKSNPRKTVRLKSNAKSVLRKSSLSSQDSTRKMAEAPQKVTFEESSESKEDSESSDELFHEEEVFSFANQDITDYDDVLGDITEEMDVTPKMRRKFPHNASKGRKYEMVDASSTTKSTVDKVREETERKVQIKGSKDEGKGSIHQRLGRQIPDANVSNPTEFGTETFAVNKRRVLVSTVAQSPEDDGLSNDTRSVKDRIGKMVKLSKNKRNASPERSISKSNRSTKVKRISKREGFSTSKESVLEKKIQRIKQQNGKILKRQMEIQREKEKFS